MQIKRELPPNFKDIVEKFGMQLNVVYTFGDAIFSPMTSARNFPIHLMKHEEVHSRQQGTNPEKWWKKYLKNDKFRLEQESEAYQAQYKYFCQNKKDLYKRACFLEDLAADLSGAIYGNICTLEQARKIISA